MSAATPARKSNRIAAIDWMRGLVMLLMVIDHASMAFDGHHVAEDSALYAGAGTMALPAAEFFTRWITHLCAPTFVFLAGTALALSVERELKEETGIELSELAVAPGWTAIADGQLIVMIRALRSRAAAEALRARILAHLAREAQPELADIRVVRGPADFDAAMPAFVTAYLARFFADGLASRPASA